MAGRLALAVESVTGATFVGRAWHRFFFRGFSEDSLRLARIDLGIALLVFHTHQFGGLLLLDPGGAAFHFLDPMWHFRLLGIQRHLPLLSFTVYAVLMVATVLMIRGRWTRLAIVVVMLSIFYLKGVRDSFTGDVHHRYLIPMHILLLFLLSRCGDARRRDASRAAAGPALHEWEASWPIKAMQVYVASFYVWSALAKLRVSGWAWFSGEGQIQEFLVRRSLRWGMTEGGELIRNNLGFTLAQYPDLLRVIGLLVLTAELIFPVVLFIESARSRALFLGALATFHVATFVLLDVNFLLIPFVYLVFFDLASVHGWVRSRLARWRNRLAAR